MECYYDAAPGATPDVTAHANDDAALMLDYLFGPRWLPLDLQASIDSEHLVDLEVSREPQVPYHSEPLVEPRADPDIANLSRKDDSMCHGLDDATVEGDDKKSQPRRDEEIGGGESSDAETGRETDTVEDANAHGDCGEGKVEGEQKEGDSNDGTDKSGGRDSGEQQEANGGESTRDEETQGESSDGPDADKDGAVNRGDSADGNDNEGGGGCDSGEQQADEEDGSLREEDTQEAHSIDDIGAKSDTGSSDGTDMEASKEVSDSGWHVYHRAVRSDALWR